MVWTCDTIKHIIKDHPPKYSPGEVETRQTEEKLSRRHHRLDRKDHICRDPSPAIFRKQLAIER